jgi:hypothetical protein
MPKLLNWLKINWFYPLGLLVVIFLVVFHYHFPWTEDGPNGEIIVLLISCVALPTLYAICYGRSAPTKSLIFRVLILASGGLWIAGKVVPDDAEAVLASLGWLRTIGLIVLVAVEGFALFAIIRLTFSPAPDRAALERQGIPDVVIDLMLKEARFWRWIWAKLSHRKSRDRSAIQAQSLTDDDS